MNATDASAATTTSAAIKTTIIFLRPRGAVSGAGGAATLSLEAANYTLPPQRERVVAGIGAMV